MLVVYNIRVYCRVFVLGLQTHHEVNVVTKVLVTFRLDCASDTVGGVHVCHVNYPSKIPSVSAPHTHTHTHTYTHTHSFSLTSPIVPSHIYPSASAHLIDRELGSRCWNSARGKPAGRTGQLEMESVQSTYAIIALSCSACP